jgi:hypothetical protein
MALAMAVWTLPGPVRGADKRTAVVEAKSKPLAAPAHDPSAFDLSYLPDDAMGVVAIHPAALFRRQGMSLYAAQLNALKKIKGLDKAMGVELSKCPLSIEQIEQVSGAVRFGRSVHEGKELGTFSVYCATVRTIQPFDWVGYLRSLWPAAEELREGTGLFYRVKCPQIGPSACFYVPDNRTVVMDGEDVIRRLLRRDRPTVPEFARGADWKKVEHDIIAIVIDNHDERIRRSTRKLVDDEEFGKFLDYSTRWVAGLVDSDEFRFRVTAVGRDAESTRVMATLISKLRDDGLKELAKEHKDIGPEEIRILEFLRKMLPTFRVLTDSTSVAFELAGGVKLVDILPLLAKSGL